MFRTTKFAMVLFAFLAAIIAMPSESSARENSLKKDKWALQFQVSNFVNVSSFQGSTFSLKKHVSDKAAWRLGLTLHFEVKDENTEIILYPNTNAPGYNDLTDVRIGIALQKVFYPNPTADVNVFWGMGPTYSYEYRLSDRENISIDRTYQDKRSFEIHSWSLGINGILGVEWFATKSISFLAEYGTAVTYSSRITRIIRRSVRDDFLYLDQDSTNRLNDISLSSSRVKFGLSVYF